MPQFEIDTGRRRNGKSITLICIEPNTRMGLCFALVGIKAGNVMHHALRFFARLPLINEVGIPPSVC